MLLNIVFSAFKSGSSAHGVLLGNGFAITGYSIIDYCGNKFKLVHSGAITTPAKQSFPLRLSQIYTDMQNLINEFKPDAISVEELFFNN